MTITQKIGVAFLVGLLVGGLAVFLIFPRGDRWHFDHAKYMNDSDILVRIDRRTGKTEMFIPHGGWRPPFPAVTANVSRQP
jgi:hypothetical protein